MKQCIFLGVLVVVVVFVYTVPTPSNLTVSFLDVGQGDSILIEGPTGIQVLVDGGATRAVLRRLSGRLSFFDRSLDAVISTHPDQDHIGGLVYVLERYSVEYFIHSGNSSDSPAFNRLEDIIEEGSPQQIVARSGMRFLLGGGAYADVLFPDRDVSDIESNTASVIIRVVYGETEFLLTGDSPQAIEKYLTTTMINHSSLESDVLKAGHHGSKTSSAEVFLEAVNPGFVVISSGENNRYGHPHQEVLNRIENHGAVILNTADSGTITFISNGKTLRQLER